MGKQLHANAIKPEQEFCVSRASVAFPPKLIRVTKALYDIMGVDVKHFIIEAYEQPVYLLVIVTFCNTHHDL